MTREQLEDAQAAAAFDGPSTQEERLEYRLGASTYGLYELAQAEASADELIAQANAVIALASRMS